MPRLSIRHMRSVLHAEVSAIRRQDPDLDAGDITIFTLPLLIRIVGVLALGLVPLIVVRNGNAEDAVLVPLIGSTALVGVCTAVVAWLMTIVISGLVVMVLYRTRPAATSQLVVQTLSDSFSRISSSSSDMTLLALVAGLVSLAIGLPTRHGDELANSVIDDLLAAQVGVLLAVLAFAFIGESIRSAVDIVDDQSLLLAWPWALIIACASWSLATTVGPFEVTRLLTILLNDWLPAEVDGIPRATVIAERLSGNAKWWAALGPLPVIALVWVITAWRRRGFGPIRDFLEDESAQ